jgi:hypothetical protein
MLDILDEEIVYCITLQLQLHTVYQYICKFYQIYMYSSEICMLLIIYSPVFKLLSLSYSIYF